MAIYVDDAKQSIGVDADERQVVLVVRGKRWGPGYYRNLTGPKYYCLF